MQFFRSKVLIVYLVFWVYNIDIIEIMLEGVKTMSSRIINAENLAMVLAQARVDANQTQKFMAKSLGKSVSTIQNWETGVGAPNLIDTLEWFNVLGLNPMKYMLNFLYPDTYGTLSEKCSDDEIRSALINYLQNLAPTAEIRKLSYFLFSNTGSSWQAQLDLFLAYNHTSLKCRVINALSIYNSYLIEKERNELIAPDCIMPDDENLYNAIKAAQQSAYDNKNGYMHLQKQ